MPVRTAASTFSRSSSTKTQDPSGTPSSALSARDELGSGRARRLTCVDAGRGTHEQGRSTTAGERKPGEELTATPPPVPVPAGTEMKTHAQEQHRGVCTAALSCSVMSISHTGTDAWVDAA